MNVQFENQYANLLIIAMHECVYVCVLLNQSKTTQQNVFKL